MSCAAIPWPPPLAATQIAPLIGQSPFSLPVAGGGVNPGSRGNRQPSLPEKVNELSS
ncbi:uncharacterized protein BP01DRAFT_360068 [Aspergillus saccharolyticus JOP 1030-1]|uniref:Uncharacterized protein n=1 Tax=Aspergillus saccharolyticus JOP 1030-1 TaxID=1450539 RepID=A0A319A2P2_9EURO|nr:hypothetical protein BP01DRAFT_360068 [Aspergillus saccharolyticus JOP 1030-1]PYH41722.1 hypothetical protein BP01DRAFT_360068 [Aspergillus saccharolyticus JOP 1030-1]